MSDKDKCVSILREYSCQIREEFGVTALSLFGSVARGDNRSDSDIDILVDMPAKMSLVVGLKHYLETLLNSSVDVIRRHSHLSPKFMSQISHDAIPIF